MPTPERDINGLLLILALLILPTTWSISRALSITSTPDLQLTNAMIEKVQEPRLVAIEGASTTTPPIDPTTLAPEPIPLLPTPPSTPNTLIAGSSATKPSTKTPIASKPQTKVTQKTTTTPVATANTPQPTPAPPAPATTPGKTDTIRPNAPLGLTAKTVNTIRVDLSWNPSTDNVGIAGYHVYRGTIMVGTTMSTSIGMTRLTPGANYEFHVDAYDVAGNVSYPSNTIIVTMPSDAPVTNTTNTAETTSTNTTTSNTTTNTSGVVNAICGASHLSTLAAAPSTNLCNAGSASSVTTGASSFTWSCTGSGGGTTASCSATKTTTATNGACGTANGSTFASAPSANLCTTGSASTVNTSTNYTWTCAGLNGGNSANCSASKQATQTNTAQTVNISLNSSGSFSQSAVTINAGDSIKFTYTNPGDEKIISFTPAKSSVKLDHDITTKTVAFSTAGTWTAKISGGGSLSITVQ